MATIFEWNNFVDFIFSVWIVAFLVYLNFEFICLVVPWGAALITLVSRTFCLVAVWLSKLLSHVRSLVYTIRKLSKNKSFTGLVIGGSQPDHAMSAMSALVDWYFPNDRPVLTIIRTSITYIGYMALRTFILSPVHASYVMMRDNAGDVILDPQPYSFDVQEDIYHFPGLVLFIPFIVLLAVSHLFEGGSGIPASNIRSQPPTMTETKTKELQVQLQPKREIDPMLERHYETLLRYIDEGLQKDLAANGTSIRRVQELEAQLEKEKVARLEAETAQSCALANEAKLRSELVLATTRLEKEQTSHTNVIAAEIKRFDDNDNQRKDQILGLTQDHKNNLSSKTKEINDLREKITGLEQRLEEVQPEKALLDKVAELDEKLCIANQETANASKSKVELSVALDQKKNELGNLERRIDDIERTAKAEVYDQRNKLEAEYRYAHEMLNAVISNQHVEIQAKNEKLAIAKGRIEYLKFNLDVIGEGDKIESDNELFANDPSEESKHVQDLVVERIGMENRIRELEAGLERVQKEADELQYKKSAVEIDNYGLYETIDDDRIRHNAEMKEKKDEIEFLEGTVKYHDAMRNSSLTREDIADERERQIRNLEARVQYLQAQKKFEKESAQAATNALANGDDPFALMPTTRQGTGQQQSTQDRDGMAAEQGDNPSTVNDPLELDTNFSSFPTLEMQDLSADSANAFALSPQETQDYSIGSANASDLTPQEMQDHSTASANSSTPPTQGIQKSFVFDVSGINFGFQNSQIRGQVQQQAGLGFQPEVMIAQQGFDEDILRAIGEEVANKPDLRTFVPEADQAQQQSEQEVPSGVQPDMQLGFHQEPEDQTQQQSEKRASSNAQAKAQLDFQPDTQPEVQLESQQEPDQQHSSPVWPQYRRDDEWESGDSEAE
ncbi:uncharacterized protein BDV14DRAFT_194741 [Aspergillus stella-maris]|uniref:uncharacterized protein n=1 Tax=Aspergillus stella-maris TaxID=1810926 RepID=UPI003CCDC65D